MSYGLYLSAAGALTNLYRQDVIANNLANLNTTGFKPDAAAIRQRLPERIEDGAFVEPRWMLEQLGGGSLGMPTTVQLTQGSLVKSDNDLDLAIQGDGFLVVGDGRGGGEDHLRLTRDGQLTLNHNGELVMAATGLPLLDENDRPIRLGRSSKVHVDRDGAIRQGGRTVARLRLADAPAPDLVKAGRNLLRLRDGATLDRRSAGGEVHQGFTEASAVDPIKTMSALVAATRAVQANVKMMQYHDHTLGQAVNTFARVA
jgi:flagellar basal-body rod protein FlgF